MQGIIAMSPCVGGINMKVCIVLYDDCRITRLQLDFNTLHYIGAGLHVLFALYMHAAMSACF